MTLGKRIAEGRHAHGLSQEQLAERLHVSPQAVSKWENDQACPDIQLLRPLAALLETSVDALLGAEPPAPVRQLPETERKPLEQLTLRVRVDTDKGDRVRCNLPMSLVKAGLAMGMKMEVDGANYFKNVDVAEILRLVENGLVGELVTVDSADGDHVVVVVE